MKTKQELESALKDVDLALKAAMTDSTQSAKQITLSLIAVKSAIRWMMGAENTAMGFLLSAVNACREPLEHNAVEVDKLMELLNSPVGKTRSAKEDIQ